MRLQMLFFVAALVLADLSVSRCDAGIIASFTPDGSSLGTQTISVGQFVDLELYLRWDGNDINYLNSPGLIAAGLGVSSSQIGVASAVSGMYGTDWIPDAMLSEITIETPAGWSGISVTQDFFSPSVSGTVVTGPPQYAYLRVGTLKYQGISAGTVTLALADYSLLDDTVTDSVLPDPPVVLDGIIRFGQTAQVDVLDGATAVPEPASGVMVVIGCLLALFKAGMDYRRKSKLNTSGASVIGARPNEAGQARHTIDRQLGQSCS